MADLVQGSPNGLSKGADQLDQINADLMKLIKHLESSTSSSIEASRVAGGSSAGGLDLSNKLKDQSAELRRRAHLFEQAGNSGAGNLLGLNTRIQSWIESSTLIAFFTNIKSFPITIYNKILRLGNMINTKAQVTLSKIDQFLSPRINPTAQTPEEIALAAEEAARRKIMEEKKKEYEALLIKYDGKSYADGTNTYEIDKSSSHPVNPPVTNSPGNRDPNLYSSAINQFGVETNPRYTPRNNNTYCNIFVWDVTTAMDAEIPHWVDVKTREPLDVSKYYELTRQGIIFDELNANEVVDWIDGSGANYGWHAVTAEEAQNLANRGNPAVAVWKNPNAGVPESQWKYPKAGTAGHVAMIRPGEYSLTQGPAIAQAGGDNTNSGRVSTNFYYGWKNDEVIYYVHD
jgi:hypothetical protein